MDVSVETVWSNACKELRSTLSKDVFDRWIGVIEALSIEGDTLHLGVQNDFYQCWLEENYLPLIQDAVALAYGSRLNIVFRVSKAPSAPQSDKPQSAEGTTVHRGRSSSGAVAPAALNPKYTFETFVVGPSNSFPHAASLAVAQSPGRAYNPLFLYGGVGLGKTHLMQAIGHSVLRTGRSVVAYVTCEAFTNEYIDALQRKALVQFRKKYRNVDVLLIDDIQFLGGKERMQEEFFHTFNALFDSHKQIVLTCDRPASEIPSLEHRLVSRFEWGLVTELEPPDIETRIAILRNKQEELNVKLPEEIINFIAEKIRSNIRRLEGALIRAASYASLTGRPLTIETVEHLLRDTFDQEKQETLTIEEIQKIVAEYFDLRLSDMTSNRRPQSIAFPRQVAMYFCRQLTSHSLPVIGSAFGKNHATVLHACRLVQHRLKEDPEFRQNMMVLQQRLERRTDGRRQL
ncbi:MAG: chromosomal replication initiator protein DnaA [Kiritimatiellae bacterium]|nr:chromosomal replication initiator protein DnaA [Kiritimatiellia bacterium]MDW8457852.1 chromosomal replication initiator protein DnaA [Verrucomicrobiota bacterium]